MVEEVRKLYRVRFKGIQPGRKNEVWKIMGKQAFIYGIKKG